MKKLILAAVLMFSLAALAQAQKTMIIVNHTPCEWWIQPRMDYELSVQHTPCVTEVYTRRFANLVAPNTWNVVAPSWPWTDCATGLPTTYDPAWIWCYVTLSPAMCTSIVTGVSGTDMGQSTWATSAYPNSVVVNTCCSGDRTITWTDLNNGNVQIDI